MAAMPLALGAPSHHGSSSFSSTVSSARRAVPVPEARRTSSNARHIVSTVGCTATATTTTITTTTLSEVDTVAHRAAPRGFNLTSSNTKMKATVTVHMKSFWSGLLEISSLPDKAAWFYHWTNDLLHREWLQLELVSELNPEEREDPISSYAKYSGTGADEEFHTYEATLTVPASFGPIGAVRVVNEHHSEMLLGDVRQDLPRRPEPGPGVGQRYVIPLQLVDPPLAQQPPQAYFLPCHVLLPPVADARGHEEAAHQ